MGINILFEIKPGESFTINGIFSSFFDNDEIFSVVSLLVYFELIISTSFIIGTGFIKCIPMTLSILFVDSASFVIDIEDVLLAIIVFGEHLLSIFSNREILRSLFSLAASMIKSESKILSNSLVGLIFFIVFSF